jgi:tetratricopeptide (TPR) repeat protein
MVLALAVWVAFGQTIRFGFVDYDDDEYVYDNPEITHGLSLKAILWAFTHVHSHNWHPLTTLTHMLDCEVYGLHPWGHHLGNLLLHAMAAILLFLAFQQMTGALWRSAFVAALFAVHPLHVESVAWISERKDVLSGLFFMLTLMAYVRYLRTKASGATTTLAIPRSPFYWVALLLFAFGLMSKPMLVTLPFILLLLDWWPLQRFTIHNARSAVGPLVREKIPFLLLSAASCAATIWAQKDALNSLQRVTFLSRVCNAVVSYSAYLWQMLYPVDLAVFYPHPGNHLAAWKVSVSLLSLLLVSAGVAIGSRKHAYLPMGWLWYLGMMVPVIGIVQVGGQARADRYTYLSQIGLYVIVAWGAVDLCGSWRYSRALLGAGAAVILASLLVLAHVQTTYWKDSISLMTHAIACTSDNSIAYNNRGLALVAQGKLAEAIRDYKRAIQLEPSYAVAHSNLGIALAALGKLPEAIQHYELAIRLRPYYANAYNNLGATLAAQGKLSEAIQDFERAVQLRPSYASAYYNLGLALAALGKLPEAIQHYERALQLKPDYVEALNNLAYVLATSQNDSVRNGVRAIALSQQANRLTSGENLVVLDTLAVAYAEAGRYPEAVETLNRAIQRARSKGDAALVSTFESQLKLYKAHATGRAQ